MKHVLEHLFSESEFWVFVSFIIFLGLLGALGVHKKLLVLLDARAQRIAQALGQARKMRSDAQKVLAQYQKRRQQVTQEVEKIMEESRQGVLHQQARLEEHMRESIVRIKKIAAARLEFMYKQARERIIKDIFTRALAQVEEKLQRSSSAQGLATLNEQALKFIPTSLPSKKH